MLNQLTPQEMACRVKIRALIFDMDGLLFDTERISIPAWQEAGQEFGYTIPTSLVLKTIGMDKRATREVHLNYFGKDYPFDEINLIKKERLKQYIEKYGLPRKEGVSEILQLVKELRLKSALATSSSRQMTNYLLTKANLNDFFDVVICGDEVTRVKPDPEIFLKAATYLGVLTEECLVLEDSPNGIRAAWEAGMLAVLVPDLREIPPEVERLAFQKMTSLVEVTHWLKAKLKNEEIL